MSGDYKYEIQLIAEELAEERYGKDFYDLSQDEQYTVFTEAQKQWVERQCDHADYLRKAARENL